MITKVTITGPDDSISAMLLIPLSYEFPFLEWGILVSQKNFGRKRFPSIQWLNYLESIKKENTQIKLSCHLCGKYVRELTQGSYMAMEELGRLWRIFERVQINFHAITHKVVESMITVLKQFPEKEFIFQYDNVNNEIAHYVSKAGINCSVLFDTSGGAGILPDKWPEPLKNIKSGYAGGISPENIEEQIKLINSKVGNIDTWIDMETHVRSDNDYQFDLTKVRKCLEISSQFIDKNL
jgi:hypothetical protein